MKKRVVAMLMSACLVMATVNVPVLAAEDDFSASELQVEETVEEDLTETGQEDTIHADESSITEDPEEEVIEESTEDSVEESIEDSTEESLEAVEEDFLEEIDEEEEDVEVLGKVVKSGECGANGSNVKWTLTDTGTLTIEGTGAMKDYFYNNPFKDLTPTKLVIKAGVTKIGNFAFYDCKTLSGKLTIPSTVVTIGDYAFENCVGFSGALTIPDSVVSMGNRVFYGCTGFSGKLTLSKKLTTIPEWAFYNCSGLSGKLTIPSSVVLIEHGAFEECKGFTGTLTIPDSVITMDYRAFSGCSGFSGKLTLSKNLTTIPSRAFNNCTGFTGTLTIPSKVTGIEGSAFSGCNGFSEVIIPKSVTNIDYYAFYFCYGLKKVTNKSKAALTLPSITNYQWEKESKASEVVTAISAGTAILVVKGNPFSDVKESDWFYNYVRFAYNHGLMTGKGTDSKGKVIFQPGQQITRAEFAQILYNKEGKPAVTYKSTFKDVPKGQWYTNAVLWAYNKGIASGKGENFDVFKPITRAELATMLRSYASYKKYDTKASGSLSSFTDAKSVPSWATDSLKWAVSKGVVSGKSTKKGMAIAPNDNASRAESATMLKNFADAFELK